VSSLRGVRRLGRTAAQHRLGLTDKENVDIATL